MGLNKCVTAESRRRRRRRIIAVDQHLVKSSGFMCNRLTKWRDAKFEQGDYWRREGLGIPPKEFLQTDVSMRWKEQQICSPLLPTPSSAAAGHLTSPDYLTTQMLVRRPDEPFDSSLTQPFIFLMLKKSGASHGVIITGNTPSLWLGIAVRSRNEKQNVEIGIIRQKGEAFLWQANGMRVDFLLLH